MDSLVRQGRETAMKNRMRKTRFMALVLSVMMVVTTIFSGVTVYADNAENGWTQQGEEQTATASDTVKVSKVTASDPEENNKNAIPSDMTEEELYQLSDEGKLTKAVLTRLGAIEPQETISVEDHIDFTCIVDDEDDQGHTDLKDYVKKDMHIESLTPGSIENAAPKTIDYGGHNHMYRRAVVGNTPVYYAGILNVGGTEYVYYVTSQKNTERTVYSVLKDGEKINLLYVHKNAYTIDYELENDGDSDGPALQADDVFGADRTEVVEKNGSYTFKVQIPRGYKATVAVVDEDGSGKREPLTGSRTTLGEMIQYNNTPTKNEVTLKNGSPKTMLLNGTYEVNSVGCNQKVLVKYVKVTEFQFSAEAWLQTQYANQNQQRITNVKKTDTFGDKHSYEWTFTGDTAGPRYDKNTFEMNKLELNGETIEVPMVTMKDTDPVESTTTMSTGTVVTISVRSNQKRNGVDAQRYYTVKIDNCYEDITVSGGNMVGHRHKEIATRRLIGVTAECYVINSKTSKLGWVNLKSFPLIARNVDERYNNTFRFKTDTGYGKPDICILSKDALITLQENDKGNYIEYLYYSKEGANPESQNYASWLPSYDGNYYFRTTEQLKEYMERSDAHGVVLLEIQGIPTKVGVNYVSGGDQKDSNGNMISPASSNIVNMPGFDNGGENGYNTINNQHVPISTLIPRDLSGKFEFDHWQVVTSLGAPKEGAVFATGQSAHLTTDAFNDLADCYHWDDARQRNVFTLQAVWKSDSVDTPINYAVHYYVDGQEIYTETHTANKGAKVVVDAWRQGTTGLSNAMLGVLERTNNAGKDYTDRGNVRYIIDKTISTTELQDLQQDNNALHVYFVTADTQWNVEKKWAFSTDQTTAPVERITVQIQRKTEDGSDWKKVGNSYGGGITLTSTDQWSAKTGKLPLYEADDVTKPYTYRVVEIGNDGKVVEEGNKITFNGSTNETSKREFLVNYQKQGDTWTILNAETPTGALKVSNTVSGAQGDKTIAWEFTVKQNLDGAGNPLNGTFGGMKFQDGTAKFELKHGESIIGVGFPAGTEFTVKETKANENGYLSTCNTENLTGQGKNFTITANATKIANFLNKKDMSKASVFLKAIKYVNNATPSDAQKYTFYLKDDSGRQIQAVQNDQAAVNFRELEYSKAGTYTYYLMEADDGKADVQYSQLVYEADVEVKEVETYGGGYKLEATVTYKFPGGGIVNGTPEFKNQVNEAALTSVRVVKHWNDKESAKRPSSVKFQLYKKNGTSLEAQGEPVEVSADSNGIWSYTWGNLDKNTDWDVEEVDIPDGYEIGSTSMDNNEWIITNCLKSSDVPTAKTVTVKKVWDDKDSTKRPAVVNVQLYKERIPHGETVTLSADNNWEFTWTDLDASAEWTVDETDVPEGYEKSIEREISEDQSLTTCTITNKQVNEEPKPPVVETVSVTANKVWEDAGYANRPQTVKLQLYRDGEAYGDAVTVSQAQGWRYVWNGLGKDHVWTVQEAEMINGYDVSVTNDGNNWVITNTRKASGNNSGNNSGSSDSDDDSDHDSGNSGNNSNAGGVDNKGTAVDSTTSGNGTDPSEAAGNTDTDGKTNGNAAAVAPPDAFVKSGRPTPGSADAAVADTKNMRKKDRNVPETGDVTHGYLWFLLAGISLTGLLALILGKEYSDRRRKS